MAYKGRFRPKNPEKYRGDPTKIIYRSLWEAKVMRFLDEHPDVIWYSSEEIFVPYRNPVTGKGSRYFPDFVVRQRSKNGIEETKMIEVKPLKQTHAPDPAKKHATKTGRISRRYLNECKTYAINDAKWKAAKNFCESRGWKFEIMTEKEIGV